MQLSPATDATAKAPGGSPVTKGSTVDYNGFLQLLIAQMKNQDPTAPTDSTQFVSQLASFSAVEQQVQTNAKLSTLLSNSKLSDADAVIGKTLTSADGSKSGKVLSVTLSETGSSATLEDGDKIDIVDGVRISA